MPTPDDESTSELDYVSLVYGSVNSSKEFASAMDRLLLTSNKDFSIPREVLSAVSDLLKIDAKLISNMYEENQQIVEMIEKLTRITLK